MVEKMAQIGFTPGLEKAIDAVPDTHGLPRRHPGQPAAFR